MHATQRDELIVKPLGITPPQIGHAPNAQIHEIRREARPDAGNTLKVFQRAAEDGGAGDGRHTVWNYSILKPARPASEESGGRYITTRRRRKWTFG